MTVSAKTTIVTRTKNRPVLLKRAIESVLSQTDDAYLHTIVNDGGDSHEIELLIDGFSKRYRDRLLLIHNKGSSGMEAASNLGIKATDSEFVVIHDDDDSWHPEFLAKMTERLELDSRSWNLGGIVCYATEIHEQIRDGGVSEIARHSIASLTDELSLWRMCVGNCFPPISFLYRRAVYEDIGGLYREDLPVQGDWEFNLRFMQHFEIGILRQHLAYYHIRSNNNKVTTYSNSVDATETHRKYNTYLRNEFLRRDLSRGQLGVGYMMNVNPMLLRADRIARRLTHVWETLKDPFARRKK